MFSMPEAIDFLKKSPDLLGDDENDPAFMVGVIILTRLGRRKDKFNTTRTVGYPAEFVASVRRNLIQGGIWNPNPKKEKLTFLQAAPDKDPVGFALDFVLAVMVGLGQIEKA